MSFVLNAKHSTRYFLLFEGGRIGKFEGEKMDYYVKIWFFVLFFFCLAFCPGISHNYLIVEIP